MNWRVALLASVAVLVVIVALIVEPIPQDPAYHEFVDDRRLFGTPNFMNVASNAGFLVVGLIGIFSTSRYRPKVMAESSFIVVLLFVGILATAFGSGWYHWNPSNDSLVWDRLGMVIGFMSLTALVIAEYGSPRYARNLLWPLMALGIVSVLYWSHTESLGRGDLRLYAMVQFVPILLIPMVLLMYPQRSGLTRWFWWLIGFYIASKLAEHFDAEIYSVGNLMSGHSLKHLLAACAPAALWYGLRQNRR